MNPALLHTTSDSTVAACLRAAEMHREPDVNDMIDLVDRDVIRVALA